MDRQQIGLKLALDALQHPLDLSDFDRRLMLQKAIYLAQASGVDLGYTFQWYLRGPYSPGLTRDAFALKAELGQVENELVDWKLDPGSEIGLANLLPLMATDGTDRPWRRLELLASVHFVVNTRQAKASDPATVESVLRKSGKDFSVAEVEKSITDLRTYGLLPRGA